MKYKANLSYIFIYVLFFSCSKNIDNVDTCCDEQGNKYLVSVDIKKKIEVSKLKESTENFENVDFSDIQINNDISEYRLLYKDTLTSTNTPLICSGALYVPDSTNENTPLYIFLHPTALTQKMGSPSEFNYEIEYGILEIIASTGVIVLAPDYIGFGNTKNIDHPYLIEYQGNKTNLNMLFSVKEYLNSQDIKYKNSLIITGYSEGAYYGMSLTRLIDSLNIFNIKKSVLGSGPYNITGTSINYFQADLDDHSSTPVYLWIISSFRKQGDLKGVSWNNIINIPYNEVLNLSRPGIQYFLKDYPYKPDILFRKDFISSFLDKKNVLYDYSLKTNNYNWTPKNTFDLSLIYTTEDILVNPKLNAKLAFNTLKNNGANVHIDSIVGKGHVEAYYYYIDYMVQSLKE